MSEQLPKLDVTCYNCKGNGKVPTFDKAVDITCDVCYGTGFQLTGAGVELLNFLRRQKKRIDREYV